MVPPVPRDLFNAFERLPALEDVRGFGRALLALAQMRFDLRECDGAVSNDRYVAHMMDAAGEVAAGDRPLMALLTCGNHANQLIQGSMLTSAGFLRGVRYNLLNDYSCMTLFFRMGGHFVRLIGVTRAYVDATLQIRRGAAPAAASLFANEFSDFLMCCYRRETRCYKAGKVETRWRESCCRHERLLRAFFQVFNGMPHEGLVHYTGALGRSTLFLLCNLGDGWEGRWLGPTQTRNPALPAVAAIRRQIDDFAFGCCW